MRMLDLFSGELGWTIPFLERGWKVYAIDLKRPSRGVPDGVEFIRQDILTIANGNFIKLWGVDFGCASSSCEQFSLWGMRNFYPNPPYPEHGIKLFNHTRSIFERAGIPYVMENVRAAQQFVGKAVNHCGPFYLWGNAVPPLMPQGIQKGIRLGRSGFTGEAQAEWYRKHDPNKESPRWYYSTSKKRAEATARVATIPPELANCVAEYAQRLIEAKVSP